MIRDGGKGALCGWMLGHRAEVDSKVGRGRNALSKMDIGCMGRKVSSLFRAIPQGCNPKTESEVVLVSCEKGLG